MFDIETYREGNKNYIWAKSRINGINVNSTSKSERNIPILNIILKRIKF